LEIIIAIVFAAPSRQQGYRRDEDRAGLRSLAADRENARVKTSTKE